MVFTCDKKDVGRVKAWQVFNVLPKTEFNLCQISVEDPRLDDADLDKPETIAPDLDADVVEPEAQGGGPARRYVWALEMTKEEWDKLYAAAFPKVDGK